MKSFKILAMGTMALAAASLATAATQYVKITGSSAFRGATTIAAYNCLNASLTGAKAITGGVAESGKTLLNGTHSILKGYLATDTSGTGDVYVIQMFWTGSVGGVLNLATNNPAVGPYTPTIAATSAWISDTSSSTTGMAAITKSGTGASQTLTANVLTGVGYEAASEADIAMSDSKQNTTPYDNTNYPDLNEVKVGVVPFVWVKGDSADSTAHGKLANFTNINANQAQQMLTAGGLPLSQFTGIAADSGYKVFPIGRDADSGTRVVTFAESGFGVFGSPVQYAGTVTSGHVSSIALYGGQTINGTVYAAGQGGYASGGNLVTPLSAPIASSSVTFGSPSKIVACLVGYLGTSDAATALNTSGSGTAVLTYNGVGITFNGSVWDYTNIKNGSYTFWGYEYVMQNTAHQFTSDAQDNFTQALIAQIDTNGDAVVSGIQLSTMVVKRNSEGGKIY